MLDAGDVPTDVAVGERLVREGTRAADPVVGVQLLQRAVDLWRGRPLADVQESPWSHEQVRRLDELLLQGRGALIDRRLGLRRMRS